MKDFEYQCMNCGKTTQLMMQERVDDKLVDKHLCVECLYKLVESSLRAYMKDHNLEVLCPFNMNESLRVCLEFADIKIQRIEPSDTSGRSRMIRLVMVIRSVVNDQMLFSFLDILDVDFARKVFPWIKDSLNKFFPESRYLEDILPKSWGVTTDY